MIPVGRASDEAYDTLLYYGAVDLIGSILERTYALNGSIVLVQVGQVFGVGQRPMTLAFGQGRVQITESQELPFDGIKILLRVGQ